MKRITLVLTMIALIALVGMSSLYAEPIIGKVTAVTAGADKTKVSELQLTDLAGKDVKLLLKSTTRLYDDKGAAITLDKISKDSYVSATSTITKTKDMLAATVKLEDSLTGKIASLNLGKTAKNKQSDIVISGSDNKNEDVAIMSSAEIYDQASGKEIHLNALNKNDNVLVLYTISKSKAKVAAAVLKMVPPAATATTDVTTTKTDTTTKS